MTTTALVQFPQDGEDLILKHQFERMIFSCIRKNLPLERQFLTYTGFLAEYGGIKKAAEAEFNTKELKKNAKRFNTSATVNRYLLLGKSLGWTYGNIYISFPHEQAVKLSDAEMTALNLNEPWVVGQMVTTHGSVRTLPGKDTRTPYNLKKSDPVFITMENLPLDMRKWILDTDGNPVVSKSPHFGKSFADICRAKGYHPAKTAAEISTGAKTIEEAAEKANKKITAEFLKKFADGKLTLEQLKKLIAQYPSLTETEIVEVLDSSEHLGHVYTKLNSRSKARKSVWVWTRDGLIGNFPSKAVAEERLSTVKGPLYFTTTDKPPKEIEEIVVATQNRINLTSAILSNFETELTEKQRNAIFLMISGDRTESEIAKELGLTPEKCKNLLETASATLLKTLKSLVKDTGAKTGPMVVKVDDKNAPVFAVDLKISSGISKIKRQSIFADLEE